MFEVKLGRELIWLSLAVISLLLVNVNWNLMTESCTVLFHEQLFYRADCFESFNQWKEWGNRILISRPCSRVILSSPSPFFLYPSQDFKLISLSGPQNMMFSLVDVYSIFSFLGGGGRWTGSWVDWVHSIYVCTHSNLFWRCLSYWLGKGIPVPNLIDLTHANWNKPYVIKPTLPTSWLASKNA